MNGILYKGRVVMEYNRREKFAHPVGYSDYMRGWMDGWMAVYMAACDADPAVRERPTDNKRPRGLKMPHLKSYTAQERKKEKKKIFLFFFLAYSK